MCRVLGVSRSGYYDWLRRESGPPRGRAAREQTLLAEIRRIHTTHRYYGSPRVHQELLRSHRVGRRCVSRLMRLHGIRARRGRPKARPRAAPPVRRPEIVDLIRRDFTAWVPDELWLTDVTQIRTSEGWLYAAVILDVFNREVISWATAGYDTPKTTLQALRDAIRIRRPVPGCIIHSDRGYQFTSHAWQNLAASAGLRVSLGERKSCFDNAAMESWFASLKTETLYPNGQPATRAQARSQLFQYIWDYNNHRLHSALGYVSPKIYADSSSICP